MERLCRKCQTPLISSVVAREEIGSARCELLENAGRLVLARLEEIHGKFYWLETPPSTDLQQAAQALAKLIPPNEPTLRAQPERAIPRNDDVRRAQPDSAQPKP